MKSLEEERTCGEAIRFARFLSGCVAALLIVSTPPVARPGARTRRAGRQIARGPSRSARDVPHRSRRTRRRSSCEARRHPRHRRPRRHAAALRRTPTASGKRPSARFRPAPIATSSPSTAWPSPTRATRRRARPTPRSTAWPSCPGSDVFDTKNVPHGAVASVHYNSTALGGIRRMHVYTPPGYEAGHDSIRSSTCCTAPATSTIVDVGRPRRLHPRQPDRVGQGEADDRRDAGRARQRRRRGARCARARGGAGESRHWAGPDPFVTDFVNDLMPYVEKNYRVLTDRQNRAIAGLSMGGNQTLNIAIPHLEKFAYVGVFSSGILGGAARRRGAARARRSARPGRSGTSRRSTTPRPSAGLKLLWFGTGKDDGLIDDDEEHGGSVEEARVRAGVRRERGRAHLAELARLPVGVHAAAVSLSGPRVQQPASIVLSRPPPGMSDRAGGTRTSGGSSENACSPRPAC